MYHGDSAVDISMGFPETPRNSLRHAPGLASLLQLVCYLGNCTCVGFTVSLKHVIYDSYRIWFPASLMKPVTHLLEEV